MSQLTDLRRNKYKLTQSIESGPPIKIAVYPSSPSDWPYNNHVVETAQEMEILQFERGNTPFDHSKTASITVVSDDVTGRGNFSPTKRLSNNRQPSQSPKRSKSRLTKSKALKPFEFMPDFLESIGHGCPGATPATIAFCRDVCGGFISRFAHFQNVFRPAAYDLPDQGKQQNDSATKLPEAKDRHELVQDLYVRFDKECYPALQKPLMELELENFSKQVISSLNAVLQKSPNVRKPVFGEQLHTIMSNGDPSKSTLSQGSSILGHQQLSSPSNMDTVAYRRTAALEEEIASLKEQLAAKEALVNKFRMDYTRDLQNLRNSLCLAVDPINRAHAESVKLTVNVFNFNDMEGLSPDLVELFNEKLQIVKEEAQIQIDKVTQNVAHLVERIEKYKNLKPENYGLMDMTLEDIFEGVAVIEPLAFPVWQALMAAFPQHHFSAIIKQIAETLNDNNDDTYDKLIMMVKDGIEQSAKQWERALDLCRNKNKQYYDDLQELRKELDQSEWNTKNMLSEQEKQLSEQHNKFLEDEVAKLKKQAESENKKTETQLRIQKEEIERLKRSKEQLDLKMAIFKWRQAGMIWRFIQELQAQYLDQNSLKDLLHEDMRKLFFSQEFNQLNNSLRQSKSMQKTVETQLKTLQSENYNVRLKVNRLLTDHQSLNWQLERLRCRESDLARIYDMEHRKRVDAQTLEKRARERVNQMSKLLEKQISLKEKFEDKLKDTLDMHANSMGAGKTKADDSGAADRSREALRQKQTKRVLEGFKIELDSLLFINQDNVNKNQDSVFDMNYKRRFVEVSCQTELQSVTSRNIDVVVLYDKPVNLQNTRPNACEQGSQSQMTTTLIDFLASGSQKYETLVKFNLIRSNANKHEAQEMDAHTYIDRLVSQERNDRLLFTQRQKMVTERPQDPKDKKLVNRANSSKAVSPGNSALLRKSQTRRRDTTTSIQRRATALLKGSSTFLDKDEVKEEDSLNSDSDKSRRSHKRGSFLHRGKKKSLTPSRTPQRSVIRVCDLGSVEEVNHDRQRMKPKLNNNKKNADLNSDDSSQLIESSTSSLTNSVTVSRSTPTIERDITARRAVELGKAGDEFSAVDKFSRSAERKKERVEIDYRRMAERKNAISLFDAYMQVYELMVKMEPKLFKTAVRSIKKHRSFKLDLQSIKRLKKLHPDLLPNVFQRLMSNEPDAKDRMQKRQIQADARQAWRNRLIDRGLIDEAKDVQRSQDIVTQSPISNLSPYTMIIAEEFKGAATGNSESQRTQNTTSIPYLSPVNIAITDRTSPRPRRDAPAIKIDDKKLRKSSASQPGVRKKKPIADASYQIKAQNSSVMTSETMQNDSQRQLLEQNSGPQSIQGVFSLPKSAYEMRVSILPKNSRSLVRTSFYSTKARKARLARKQAKQVENSKQSWHFSVDKSKSVAVPKASRMPPSDSSTCFSRSQRFAKVVQEKQQQRPCENQHTDREIANDGEVVILEGPDPCQSNTIANSSHVRGANDSIVTDYESKVQSLGPQPNFNTHVTLRHHRVMKRPATCRPGGTQKAAARPGTATDSKKSTAAESSRQQFALKRQLANSSTLAQTLGSRRPLSDDLEKDQSTTLSPGLNTAVSTCQRMSKLLSEHSINSLMPKKRQTTGACPVKAFDMSHIPLMQNEQKMKKIGSPLNYINFNSNVIQTGKPFVRAQSATNNKLMKTIASCGQAQATQASIQNTLNAMMATSGQKVNKVAIKVAPRINISSEEQLEVLHTIGSQIEGNGDIRQAVVTQEHEKTSQRTIFRQSDQDQNEMPSKMTLNNEEIMQYSAKTPSATKKTSLIKVSDQLASIQVNPM